MPWRPSYPDEVPTLGFDAIDWIETYLAHPLGDASENGTYKLYREQHEFLLKWYAVNPKTGRFAYRRGLLGRPRGFGKSPFLAAIAVLEALAPIVPDGWDAYGQPVGRTWSSVRGMTNVQISAVSEAQTKNTWSPLLNMVRDGSVFDDYDLDAMDTFISLPDGGKIYQMTTSARTVKGGFPVLSVMDQTEEWVPGNGGVKLAQTIRNNATKGAVISGRTIESPNAFIPGEDSVAEATANAILKIKEGRTRSGGILYDHREAPADTDLKDYDSLAAGLRVSYGDASSHPGGCVIHDPPCPPGHKDIDELIEGIWDPDADAQVSRSDFLNQITHASNSWLSKPQIDAAEDQEKIVSPKDAITLGFDGSRGRKKGKADATALIGCRVSDGHFFEIKIWEQPDGKLGEGWVTPQSDVDRVLKETFRDYNVVGFYADPAGWVSMVAAWESKFGKKMTVKASRENPFTLWPQAGGAKSSKVVTAVEELRAAIVNRDVSHDGSSALTRHLLNARKSSTKHGYLLYKKFPESPDKIDGAYAMTLAFKARNDALTKGAGDKRTPTIPRKIR